MTLPVQLTDHFSRHEALRSATAEKMGIENVPESGETVAAIQHTAHRMEGVRNILGSAPILVSSWYRCPELNKAVGGVPNSAHQQGFAVDFTCPSFGPPLAVARRVAGRVGFDQLIYEYGRWVHISFVPSMRGEVLTAMSDGYRNGLVEG